VLADLGHALASSRDLVAKARGRVTVAATPLMSSMLLPEAIARYAKLHPGVRVVLRDTQAAQIQPKVRDGAADFGIGTFERSGRELDAEPLMIDTLVLACPATHPLARRAADVAWRELGGHAFIALSRDNSVGQLIGDCLAVEGVEVDVVHEVAYLSTVLGMVEAGLGVAVLPSYARPATPARRVVMRRLVKPEVRRETSFLTRHGRTLSPAAQSFKEFLQGFVAERLRAPAQAPRRRAG
jgi:DNA-binding transcriptional LysR family regulator